MATKRSATFLGPNKGLTIIGEHCFAYSGFFSADTTKTSRLTFATGKYYVVGEFRLAGNIDASSPNYGSIAVMTVEMNGSEVLISKTEANTEAMPTSDVMPVVIPPNTTVEVFSRASATEANFKCSINLSGRVYDKYDN